MIYLVAIPLLISAYGSDASFVRPVSSSYLGENGEIIFDNSERDFYPTAARGKLCPMCDGSCPETPQCEAGVSLVPDGCGCCKICARQLGEECDRDNVCDEHKGLYCDGNSQTCKARPGRNCFISNKWYENGALFSPSCRVTCSCIDGDIGCFPKCKPPPPGCSHPRLVKSASNCCGVWRCSPRPSEFLRGHGATSFTFRGSCILQTTEWSPCSQTCDFGTSERVTNDNEECKMTKESRICMIRPCKDAKFSRKSKRSCRKNLRRPKKVRFSLSGCLSQKTFRPRYCGTCRHPGKCCRPKSTRTIDVQFRCKDSTTSSSNSTTSYIMQKRMMVIQKCECGRFCSGNDLIPAAFHAQLRGDTHHH